MNKNFEQMLRLVDYVDGLMVVDKNCIIRHYYTAYPDLVNLRQDEPLNRSLFEIYPSLKREDSYICRALETGESFINYEQTYINYKGDSMEANCSAVPIKEHGEVVGVIDMVIYKDAHVTERRLSFDISLISALTKSYNTSDQSLEDIVTQDGEMIRIKEKILQTADSDAHVLVYGKTGTGKELIVNAIQKTSRRKDAPFIKQNCASIPSTLLESILFGTTKGSYTGAKDTPGLFELADGGTLFLDEINSMELTAQAKLLRVLEDNCIRRIGAKEEKQVNVRIIAAVNEDPEGCVERNKIREDIFYRLCVLRYDIPELYRRKGDIPLLMEYFRKHYNKKFHKQIMAYSSEVQDIFLAYNWPGNVRELKNVIESAFHNNHTAILTRNDIPNYILSRLAVDTIRAWNADTDSLEEAVKKERAMMAPVKERADFVIDTSRTSTAQLRGELLRLFGQEGEKGGMTVSVTSFGFKYGLPLEADLVFDVRFMPNPFYMEDLRPRTGLDQAVADYVFHFPQTQDYMRRLEDLLAFSLPLYAEEGKTSLTIAVGCTGGHHRSVAVTHALAGFIHGLGYQVLENHRDMPRGG